MSYHTVLKMWNAWTVVHWSSFDFIFGLLKPRRGFELSSTRVRSYSVVLDIGILWERTTCSDAVPYGGTTKAAWGRQKKSVAELSYVRALNDGFKAIPHGLPRPPLFFEREKAFVTAVMLKTARPVCQNSVDSVLCELNHSLPKSWRHSGLFSWVPFQSLWFFFFFILLSVYIV